MNQPVSQVFGRELIAPPSPLLLVIAWAAIGLVSSVLAGLVPSIVVTLVHFALLAGVGYVAWSRPLANYSWRERWFGDLSIPVALAWGIGVGIPTWVVLNYGLQPVLIAGFEFFNLPVPEAQANIRAALTQGGWLSVLQILITVLLVPTAEELFYRGAFFNATAARVNLWLALGIQALCFGLVHFSPIVVVVTAVLGLIAGYMVIRNVAMVIPVVIHIVFNLLSVLVVLF